MERAYPVDAMGLPVSYHELGLPDSRLNLDRRANYNFHHYAYSAKMYGRFVLTAAFRNLEDMQTLMPKDEHVWLHQRYGPPPKPQPAVMLDRLDEAREVGEALHIFNRSIRDYEYLPITDEHWTQILKSYEELKD